MAKKKNKKKVPTDPRPAPPSPEQQQAENISKLVGPDAAGASDLANKFFEPGALGRVSTGFDAQGNRIAENQDVLDRQAALRNFYMDPTQRRSQETQDVLGRQKAALAGYDNPELQGMREQAQAGINTDYKTRMMNQAKIQGRAGVGGAAAAAQALNLDRARMKEQGNLEQGLFVKGADEKRRALGEYASSVAGVEGTEFQRMQDTQRGYADQLAATRADELGRQQFNLGQVGAERAGQAGTYFGGVALGQQNRQADRANKISKQMLQIAKQQGRRSNSSSTGGRDIQGYVNEASNLYK